MMGWVGGRADGRGAREGAARGAAGAAALDAPRFAGALAPTPQFNGIQWKKLGPYNLKCRRVVTLHPSRLGRMSEDGSGDAEGAAAEGSAREQQRQQQQQLKGGGGLGVAGGGGGGGPDAMQQDPGVPPGLELHAASQAARMAGSAPLAISGPGHAAARAAAQAAVANGGGGGQAVDYLVKFECQLYKIRDDEYAVDVQRLEGDIPVFLDVCGRVLGDLRVG
jgi:5'-AMP-activated protein kinase catalytic alpha subunit